MVIRVLAVCLLLVSPALASTHAVPAGGDLQAAIDAAQPGDIIELEPGATYTGNFRLTAKPGDAFIIIRTRTAPGELPGPGSRIDRAHAPWLAKLRSPNGSPALATVPGAHHWRVELVEFLPNATFTGDIIAFGAGAGQTDLAQMPYQLVLDRVYVHGDPARGQKRGLALNSGAAQVVNSHFEDFKVVGQEAQAIAGWNGTGPYLIENNYIEAAAQSVMFGGSDATVWNLVPSDITVRRNVFTKPLSWRSERWLIKNGFELKNARRVLVEGNIIEHVWAGGQNGYAVLFTVRNQDGRAPWSTIEDVTFRYNIIRNAGGAINVVGIDNNHASGQVRRLRIADNLVYGIERRVWGGTGDFIQLGATPREVVIEHNTVIHDGIGFRLYGNPIESAIIRDNVLKHNTYGVKGDGTNNGNPTIARYLPGAVIERNVFAGGPAAQYPAGNYFPSLAEFEAQFVDLPGENFAFVAGSLFSTAGANGRALGADLALLHRVMGGAADAPGRLDDPDADQPGDTALTGQRRPRARPKPVG